MEPARSRHRSSSGELGETRGTLPATSVEESVRVAILRRLRSRTSAFPNESHVAVRGRARIVEVLGALDTDAERESGIGSPVADLSMGDPSRAGKAEAYE